MADPITELKAHAKRLTQRRPHVDVEGMIAAAMSRAPTAVTRRLVGLMATAVMILGGNVALAAAAAPSVPGDPLHPVDRAFEWVADQLGIGGSRLDQRLSEAERVARNGDVANALSLINEALDQAEPGLRLARLGNDEGSQVSAIARLLRAGASTPQEVSELARRVGATNGRSQAVEDLDDPTAKGSIATRGLGSRSSSAGVNADPGLGSRETETPDRGQDQSSNQGEGQGQGQGQAKALGQGQGQELEQGQGQGHGQSQREGDASTGAGN